MKYNEQKHLIHSILNHSKNIDKSDKNFGFLEQITEDFKRKFHEERFPDQEFDPDFKVETDDFMKAAMQAGEDPIELLGSLFKDFEDLGDIDVNGVKVPFSKSSEIFNMTKEKYKEYLDSEDINNF